MNVAILCNGTSEKVTDRVELVHDLKSEGHDVYIGGILTDIINDYYASGEAYFMPIDASRRNTNPIVELKSIFNIICQIRKHKIDATLIYGVKNHPAMAIASKLGGVSKIVCVVNGSGNLFRVRGIKGKIIRFMAFPMLKIAYSVSTSICFQNSDDRKMFEQKHLIGENDIFITGGSGTNLNIFLPSKLPDEMRFLFLARITTSKGIDDYIKAAEIVKKTYPNVKFDIVGPLDSSVEASGDSMLDSAVKKGIVMYHGSTEDVSAWMSYCKVFVYPSYYPEGVPRCAIQAISSGRPIITCNTPGCKETVIDGLNGFLVEPRNPRELASKMIWMIENPEKLENMGKESRRYAEEKFDVMKINQLLIKKLV